MEKIQACPASEVLDREENVAGEDDGVDEGEYYRGYQQVRVALDLNDLVVVNDDILVIELRPDIDHEDARYKVEDGANHREQQDL